MEHGVVYGLFLTGSDGSKSVYIGSSDDYWKRWDRHMKTLRRGDHHTVPLQRAFNAATEYRCRWVVLSHHPGILPLDLIKVEADTIEAYRKRPGVTVLNQKPPRPYRSPEGVQYALARTESANGVATSRPAVSVPSVPLAARDVPPSA